MRSVPSLPVPVSATRRLHAPCALAGTAVAQLRALVGGRRYGAALWEQLQSIVDARLKANGVQNIFMPSLIPSSFLSKEASHVRAGERPI